MPRLSVAIDRYERHLPLFDGLVPPPEGFVFDMLEVGQEGMRRGGVRRHERMLRDGEFDIAEVSLASYVAAKDRGLPFTAVPVFPRRLFSQTQMFVRTDSPIQAPADLVGRRVALQSFQTTLAVLAKGDLGFAHGVPWRSIHWHLRDQETIGIDLGADASVTRLPAKTDLASILAEGGVDALFYSRIPTSPSVAPGRLRRLFPDAAGAALGYFRAHGWFPIMHVLAMKQEVAEAHPSLPAALLPWYAAALEAGRRAYDDPGWLLLPLGRLAYEASRQDFGDDPWPLGMRANRPFLARFLDYARDQGLLSGSLEPEDLFHPDVRDT